MVLQAGRLLSNVLHAERFSAEVENNAQPKTGGCQVVMDLGNVIGIDGADRFQLQDSFLVNEQIGSYSPTSKSL